MSELLQCESESDAALQSPPGSPDITIDKTPPGQQSPTTASSTTTTGRKSKAPTFSIISFAAPRRPVLSRDTFDANAPPYRQVSAAASEAIAPLTQQTNVEFARRPLSPQLSSDDKKENRKVSAELTKQLESLLKPASRSTSGSSSRARPAKSTTSSSWAVTASSIAIRNGCPVQSITTQTWEPPPDLEPPPDPIALVAPEIQSEYFSFPPFDSYPKNARPGLRTRCSDKSWVLLQKLKGKIVEMHNNGQLERSGRSSSRTSLSSRKSRRSSRSPSKPTKGRSDTIQSARRRASESEATSARPDLGVSVADKAATLAERSTRSSGLNQDRVAQECDDNNTTTTTSRQINSTTPVASPPQKQPSPGKHITIVEPDQQSDTRDDSKSPGKRKDSPNIVGLTQSIATTIFQSLVTIATGEVGDQSIAAPSISRESSFRGRPSNTSLYQPKESRGAKEKRQGNANSADSSEDEMSFLEYVKRFADGSPPPGRRIGRIMSPACGQSASLEVPSEHHSDKGKEAIPRTVTFEEQPAVSREMPVEESDSEAADSPSAHEFEPLSPNKTMEEIPEQALYRAEDYNIITEYFYNTQSRLLRLKWPFLHDNEVKYLIDSKWLEMEWEDLEEWAQESAKHIDEEAYVEPDLFEDIEIVDPRSLGHVNVEAESGQAITG
ncbi:hypothetical protein TWF696_005864 [Orbilia brochopaga]|uniref:Uncharacterized protein n=1 Tax=Orbilia brochopaga TaxID=3140254 RepID=A0AAV9UWV9_9PEZI